MSDAAQAKICRKLEVPRLGTTTRPRRAHLHLPCSMAAVSRSTRPPFSAFVAHFVERTAARHVGRAQPHRPRLPQKASYSGSRRNPMIHS
jgi:hypothetical protein